MNGQTANFKAYKYNIDLLLSRKELRQSQGGYLQP